MELNIHSSSNDTEMRSYKSPQVVSGQSLHSQPRRTASRSSSVSWAEPISNTRLFDTDSPIKSIYSNPAIIITTPNNGSSAPQDNAIIDKHCTSSRLFARPGICTPRVKEISPAATEEIALRYSVRQILRKRNPKILLTSLENNKLTSSQTENGIGTQNFLPNEQGLFFRNGNSKESRQDRDLSETNGRKPGDCPPNKTNHLPTPPPTTGSQEPNNVDNESNYQQTASTDENGEIDYKSDDENCEDELIEHDDSAHVQLETAPADAPPLPPLFSPVHDDVALPIVNSSSSLSFPPVHNPSPANEVISNPAGEVKVEVMPSAGGMQREGSTSSTEEVEEVIFFADGMQRKRRQSTSSSTDGESRNSTPRSSTVEEGEITDHGENSSSIGSSDLNRTSPEDGEVLECLSLSVLSLGDVNQHDSALFPPPSPTSPISSSETSSPTLPSFEPTSRNFILKWTEKSGRGKKRIIIDGSNLPSAKRPKTSLSSSRTTGNHRAINKDETPSLKSQHQQIAEPCPKTKPSSAKATDNGVRLPKKNISHSDILKSRALSTKQDHRRRSQLVDSYKNVAFIREVQLAEWEGIFGRILYKHEEMVVAETADRDDVVRILDDILALHGPFTKTWKASKAGKFQSPNFNRLIEKLDRFEKAEQFGDEVRGKCKSILNAVAQP